MPLSQYIAPGRAQCVRRLFVDNNGFRILVIDVYCTGSYHIERHETVLQDGIPNGTLSHTVRFANPSRCDCLSETTKLPEEALDLIRQFRDSEISVAI